MLSEMNKQTFLAEIRATHEPLVAVVGTLADDAWAEPLPDMNGWTRKDALAHVGWWSDHSARVVTALRAGGVPYERDPDFDIDYHLRHVSLPSPGSHRQGDVRHRGAQPRRDAAAGADPDHLLRAQAQELLGDDRKRRRAHARRLHAHRVPLVGPGPAVHGAVLVDLTSLRQPPIEALGDLASPIRVARKEDEGRVVAGFGTEVDLRHGVRVAQPPVRSRSCRQGTRTISSLPSGWPGARASC